jgi:outer membrane murein-binding lipoprotein Lpp
MTRIGIPLMFLLLAGCSGHASKEDQLSAAANQSTPEAASVLNGAAENGMNAQAALNEAARAQAVNAAVGPPQRYEARPNSAANPNPPEAGEPPQKVPVGNSG